MKTLLKAVKPGLALLLLTLPLGVHAQMWQYSAKFICGAQTGDTDVVKGLYATTVNIHNSLNTTVDLRKKAVIALPERTLPRGRISPVVIDTLKPDEAMGVDCRDIRSLFPVPPALPTHIEGFLVVEPFSPAGIPTDPLDVVAKYTARHRTGTNTTDPNSYDVETLDVERIPPKKLQ